MAKINPVSKSQPKVPSSPSPFGQSGPPHAGNEVAKDNMTPSPFPEERIRAKAHQVWKRRIAQGKSGTPEQDWQKAIEELQLSWWDRWWAWTGIPDKKGWDLLTSISLPLIVFLGGTLFTYWNNQQQQRIAVDNRKQDLQIADDKAKHDTLVKYLDQMAEALNSGLLKAPPTSEKFAISQARTITTLLVLDRRRQNLLIQFLNASGLNSLEGEVIIDKFGQVELRKGDRLLFYGAQMANVNLANSDLRGALLIGANLRDANLGCNPPDSRDPEQCSDLSGASLINTNLRSANLTRVDLSFADLRSAFLRGADLYQANLTTALLRYADLSGADLSEANLSYTNLSSTYVEGADFSNAILFFTDLVNSKALTPQQLTGKGAPLLCNVRFPEYIKGIDPYRDCDRIPQELVKRFPKDYPDLQSAQKVVNKTRQLKFTLLE